MQSLSRRARISINPSPGPFPSSREGVSASPEISPPCLQGGAGGGLPAGRGRGWVFAPLVALSLAACGSSQAAPSSNGGSCSATLTFPTSSLSTVTSDGGKLSVAIYSAPYQPLIAGTECLELVVTDPSSGDAVDGLSITMTPWMPAMGHGADTIPLLTALGQGRYVFTEVGLFMPGEWQLRTQFSGQVTDSVEPTFNVD